LFELLFSNKSSKFVKNCDCQLKERLKQIFLILNKTTIPAKLFDLKKISGTEDTYRIKIGQFRIVYKIYWQELKIKVLTIERRDEHTYN